MIYFFYTISIIGLYYFFVNKRAFDFFSLGYFSSLIYFLPGYFGYVIAPSMRIEGLSKSFNMEIDQKTYLIMLLILLMIIVSATIYDLTEKHKEEIKGKKVILIVEDKLIHIILGVILILGMIFTLYNISNDTFTTKDLSGSKSGLFLMLWSYPASILLIFGVIVRKKVIIYISFISLLILFFSGDRTAIALAGIGVITVFLNNKKRSQLIKVVKFKYTLFIFIFGLIMFNGKMLYGSFQTSGFSGFFKTLTNKSIYVDSIVQSEPFAIQMILNYVMLYDFKIGFDHLKDLPLQLLVLPSLFGGDTSSFSNIIKGNFFSFVDYGIAYNIWAEGYAVGGWLFLFLIIIMYCIGLAFYSKAIKISGGSLKALFILMGSYWAFYIHRNSIETIISYERYILLIYLVCLMGSSVLLKILYKKRNSRL